MIELIKLLEGIANLMQADTEAATREIKILTGNLWRDDYSGYLSRWESQYGAYSYGTYWTEGGKVKAREFKKYTLTEFVLATRELDRIKCEIDKIRKSPNCADIPKQQRENKLINEAFEYKLRLLKI
jgi:hypothetical protein